MRVADLDRNLSDYAARINTLEEDVDIIFKKNTTLEDRVKELEEIVSAQTIQMEEMRRELINSNRNNGHYPTSPLRRSPGSPIRRRRSRSLTPSPRLTEKEVCTVHFDNRGRVNMTDELLRTITAKYGKIVEVYVAQPKQVGHFPTWGTVRFETKEECQLCKDDWKEIQSVHKIGVNAYKSNKRHRRI